MDLSPLSHRKTAVVFSPGRTVSPLVSCRLSSSNILALVSTDPSSRAPGRCPRHRWGLSTCCESPYPRPLYFTWLGQQVEKTPYHPPGPDFSTASGISAEKTLFTFLRSSIRTTNYFYSAIPYLTKPKKPLYFTLIVWISSFIFMTSSVQAPILTPTFSRCLTDVNHSTLPKTPTLRICNSRCCQ